MKMTRKKFKEAALRAGYRSGFEDETAKYLKEKGVEFTYEKERIEWFDSRTRHYTPDFALSNGIVIETKGRFVSTDRRKHIEIRKQFPDLDLRFVFQNSRIKLYKGAKSCYADWCKRHGFKYADKIIPDEWLEE